MASNIHLTHVSPHCRQDCKSVLFKCKSALKSSGDFHCCFQWHLLPLTPLNTQPITMAFVLFQIPQVPSQPSPKRSCSAPLPGCTPSSFSGNSSLSSPRFREPPWQKEWGCQRCSRLIPETCDYVTLHGKRDLAWLTYGSVRWGDRWSWIIQVGLIPEGSSREGGRRVRVTEEMRWWRLEREARRYYTAGLEHGRGHEPKKQAASRIGKGKKHILSQRLWRHAALLTSWL